MSSRRDLNAYLVTFNCGRALVNSSALASHFFDGLSNSSPQDGLPELIVLHLQEIAPLADAFRGPQPLRRYLNRFDAAVELASRQKFADSISPNGNQNESSTIYADPVIHHAGLTAIMLFVRRDMEHHIDGVLLSDVGVGVQQMGNKGAAALRVAWNLAQSSNTGREIMNLTFVSAHLAPMEDALDRRNQDFLDIAAGLVFEELSVSQTPSKRANAEETNNEEEEAALLSTDTNADVSSPSSLSATHSSNNDLIGIYAPDTYLFFAGDLNYRTSSTPPAHDDSDQKYFPQPNSPLSSANHYLKLLEHDQLTTQLHAGKTLHGLTEAPITFPPTYKYSSDACSGKDMMLDSEVTEWKWSTHRWPSWCDRILFNNNSSSSPSSSLRPKKYTCLPLLATSDHRPVTLSITIPQTPISNSEFSSSRPVPLNPHWKSHRQTAQFKEQAIGNIMRTFATREGLTDLGSGFLSAAAVAAITEFSSTSVAAAGVYVPVIVVGLAGVVWAYVTGNGSRGDGDGDGDNEQRTARGLKRAIWPVGGAIVGAALTLIFSTTGQEAVFVEKESSKVFVERVRGSVPELRR